MGAEGNANAAAAAAAAGAAGEAALARAPAALRALLGLFGQYGPGAWPKACVALVLLRLLSPLLMPVLVQDCDEVFNYFEPLHRLAYGMKGGFALRTWEYSANFALRSWFYLLLHMPVVASISKFAGLAGGKVLAFRGLKAALGLCCGLAEVRLAEATRRTLGPNAGWLAYYCLVGQAGLALASSTFLPGTFAAVALAFASAEVIEGRRRAVAVFAAVGLVVGWPVAGVAAAPLAAWTALNSAGAGRLVEDATFAAKIAGGILVVATVFDSLLYGRFVSPQLSFLRYNVGGGGQSSLYGTEPFWWYLLNGFLQLNIQLPLGLAAPFLLSSLKTAKEGDGDKPASAQAVLAESLTSPAFALACVPCVWTAVLSLLPHKEERFLYVAYPQFAFATALVLDRLSVLYPMKVDISPLWKSAAWTKTRKFLGIRGGKTAKKGAHAYSVIGLTLTGMFFVSFCRLNAVMNYTAPAKIWGALPRLVKDGEATVCVGAEWHEYPSSFFLPGPQYRLGFLKTDFKGLLPFPFNSLSSEAPVYFNDKNKANPNQWIEWPKQCDFLVGTQKYMKETEALDVFSTKENRGLGVPFRWNILKQEPYLDREASPAWARAFHIPILGDEFVKYGKYLLLEKGPYIEKEPSNDGEGVKTPFGRIKDPFKDMEEQKKKADAAKAEAAKAEAAKAGAA